MTNGKWEAVDVMTNEVLGRYDTEFEAHAQNPDKAIDLTWKPPRRKSNKRPNKFPEA